MEQEQYSPQIVQGKLPGADEASFFERLMAQLRGETVLSQQRATIRAPEKGTSLGLEIKNADGTETALEVQIVGSRAFLFNPAAAESGKPVRAIPIDSQASGGKAMILSADLDPETAKTLGLANFSWGDRKIMIGLTGDQPGGFSFEMNAQGFASRQYPRVKPKLEFTRGPSLIIDAHDRKPNFVPAPPDQLGLRDNPRLALPDVGSLKSGVAQTPTRYLDQDVPTQAFYCDTNAGGEIKKIKFEFPVDFNRQIAGLRQQRRQSREHEPELFLQHISDERTFFSLIAQEEIPVGTHKIRRAALLSIIAGANTRLTKFSAFSQDAAGQETRMIFLPVLTVSGDIVILQLGLESYGRVKDALLTSSNESENRLAAPQNFQLRAADKKNPRYAAPTAGGTALNPEVMHFQEARGNFYLQRREYSAQITTTNGERKIDEDLTYCVPVILPDGKEIILFGINDGMGGHNAGDKAAVITLSASYNWLASLSKDPLGIQRYVKLIHEARQRDIPVEQVLLEHAVRVENEVMRSWNQAASADAGTTRTGGMISGDWLFTANAGDSRTYLQRRPGLGFEKITIDHSLVALLAASGQIKSEEILIHPQRNQIYRSVGEKPNLPVDVEAHYFPPGARVFFCCDGFWEAIGDLDGSRLTELAASLPMNEMVSSLVGLAAESAACDDNVSAGMVARIK